jgi:branched-chain amino acid transport system permease protein
MWGLHALVQRTTLGRSIRAVAEDREMAAIMGVNVRRVIATTFFLGSALGGAAGVLVGLYYTQIDFFMGYSAGLKAFTAAVLGGIGNIRGAMLGGLVLGIVESLAVTFVNPAFKDVIAFLILILTLVFRPTGLLGESLPDWEKV